MSRLTTIARGDGSHVAASRRAIVRTGEEWQALWAAHAGPGSSPPPIDFTAVTLAAAFAGEKPSAGHTIEITAADHADHADRIRLTVDEHGPGRGTVAAAIITSPFHMVAVQRGVELVWVEDRGPTTEDRSSRTSNLDPRSSTNDPRSSTGLEPRTAAALAYLAGPFSGALVLMAESTNQDVRFHAWQSIVGLGGLGLAVMASYTLAAAALFVSATAVSLMFNVAGVIWIVLAMVWLLCLWKAWSGGRWKLPLVGDFAERFN